MARTVRKNFTDSQKSEIFVRDRGICAFSGKSLWLPDYGFSPTFDIDWVDHILPASKGGGNEIENGICASSFYNSKKSNNSRDTGYLFHSGRPTLEFYKHFEVVPIEVVDHLLRFSEAAVSDWYLNRALSRLMYGLEWIVYLENGTRYVRDDKYYAKSSLKMLNTWRKKSKNDASLEERGLISVDISEDQKLLLSFRELETEADILDFMQAHYIWFGNGLSAVNELASAETAQELQNVVSKYRSLPKVPNRVVNMLTDNLTRLSGNFGYAESDI
ncbi:HNH endonuclease [Leucothrix pacifica]|uniref:HNH endonuclease n=1 Tax=Leucothrix pacifica TaxID=1247513 RepID=A0A317CAG2_9GAMM|nr:hypothetical protein [Leucothrix pacifica]PWQ95121.1 hypothetical protein DKW60_15475 [Leucothrix pacifica]